MVNETSPTHSITKHERRVVTLWLLLAPFVYFYPALTGAVFLAPGDGWSQNYPIRALIGELLARGQMPFWNPGIFAGTPLLASVYPGVLYPPNWLFALLNAPLAQTLIVITTFHLALWGMYRCARQFGCARWGALLASLAFGFGGFFVVHIAQMSRIAAAAWLPWVLLAIGKLQTAAAAPAKQTARLWRWMALGALFVALQFLAGEPQMLIFTVLLAAAVALAALWPMTHAATRVRFVLALCGVALLAGLLCLPQLLPTLELLAQSERSDPGPTFLDPYSLPPWQLSSLFFPYFFGGAFRPPYRTPYWGAEISAVLCGYVGLLTWLLALIALRSRARQAWFWFGIGVIALLLAFGGYLPFKLNHWFYAVPVYRTFRGLYKHQLESIFALALLAGLGATQLLRASVVERQRWLRFALLGLGALVGGQLLLYRFWSAPRPSGVGRLHNAEALIPLVFFVLSGATLWLGWRTMQTASSWRSVWLWRVWLWGAMPLLLLLELASFGHFYHWRGATFDPRARAQDPPAVQVIKQRETTSWAAPRVLSVPLLAADYTARWPEDDNHEWINQANSSLLRGLPSASGYDVLRPVRTGELTGSAGSAIRGFVQEQSAFGLADRGLDLLNVKYVLAGAGGATRATTSKRLDGIEFSQTNLGLEFTRGKRLVTDAQNAQATEIALITTLANSAHLRDGMPLLQLRLHTRAGQVIERTLEAGRDSAEWAYDRADVRAGIQHQRAPIAVNLPSEDSTFQLHHYLARLAFPRTAIERIEWNYLREDATLYVLQATLYDADTKQSHLLSPYYFAPERWRAVGQFDQVTLYENLRVLPRAWFVEAAQTLPATQILPTIKSGTLPDGAPFDPARVALFAAGEAAPNLPSAAQAAAGVNHVSITRYEANRIELATAAPRAGLLVLSEIAYAGWRAEVDGRPVPLYRADYHLRSLLVPAGARRVVLTYRPTGWPLALTGCAMGLLLCGLMLWQGRRK